MEPILWRFEIIRTEYFFLSLSLSLLCCYYWETEARKRPPAVEFVCLDLFFGR